MTFQLSLILSIALPHPQYYSPFPLPTQSLTQFFSNFPYHHHDDLPFLILTPTLKKTACFHNFWNLSRFYTHFKINFYSIHLLEIFIISSFLATEYNSSVYIHLCLLSTYFEGYLCCFYSITLVNREAMDIADKGPREYSI